MHWLSDLDMYTTINHHAQFIFVTLNLPVLILKLHLRLDSAGLRPILELNVFLEAIHISFIISLLKMWFYLIYGFNRCS